MFFQTLVPLLANTPYGSGFFPLESWLPESSYFVPSALVTSKDSKRRRKRPKSRSSSLATLTLLSWKIPRASCSHWLNRAWTKSHVFFASGLNSTRKGLRKAWTNCMDTFTNSFREKERTPAENPENNDGSHGSLDSLFTLIYWKGVSLRSIPDPPLPPVSSLEKAV